MIELFDCLPMAARISRKQCEHNRLQRDDHSSGKWADSRCNGCAGLGEQSFIDPQEVIEMAIKNKPCKLHGEGCKAFAWKAGYCWKHHPDHVANKAAARADKQAIRDIHKAEASVQEIKTPPLYRDDPVDTIANKDFVAFLRQKYEERFEEGVSRLNKARTPYEYSQLFLAECSAIIELSSPA